MCSLLLPRANGPSATWPRSACTCVGSLVDSDLGCWVCVPPSALVVDAIRNDALARLARDHGDTRADVGLVEMIGGGDQQVILVCNVRQRSRAARLAPSKRPAHSTANAVNDAAGGAPICLAIWLN